MNRTPLGLALIAIIVFAADTLAGPGPRQLEGPEPQVEFAGTWRRTLPPISAIGFSSVYDPERGQWLLAGMDGTAARSELWSSPVNGQVVWTAGEAGNRIMPGLVPVHTAWDGAADRFIALLQPAGSAFGPYELWECARGTGDTWRKIEPTGEAPAPRTEPVLAWDQTGRRLFLLGGRGADGHIMNDGLWMLSLGSDPRWDRVVTKGNDPTPRVHAGVAFIEDREWLVLLGGTVYYGGVENPRTEDVWFLDLTAELLEWRLVAWRAGGPGSAEGSSVIADPARNRFLVVPGLAQGASVWQMSLDTPGTWTLAGSGSPGLWNPTVGRDEANDAVLMMSESLDLWRLDLESVHWTAVDTDAAMKPGFTGPLALDPRDGSALSVGFKAGFVDGVFRYMQTVTKYVPGDPAHLEVLSPAGTSPNRILGSAVWDAHRRRWLFVGTTGSATAVDGVATLETVPTLAWSQVATVGLGPVGERLTAVYERERDRVIVFEEDPSGLGVRDDAQSRMRVWTLALGVPAGTPAVWTLESIDGPIPPAHNDAAVSLDRRRDRLVLHGGTRFIIAAENEAKVYDDVWTLALGSPMRWAQVLPEGNVLPRSSWAAADLDPQTDRIAWIGGAHWDWSEPDYQWTGRDSVRTFDCTSGLPDQVFATTGYVRVPSGRTLFDARAGRALHFPYGTAWEWEGPPRIDARLSLRRLTTAPRVHAPLELIVHGDDRFDPLSVDVTTVELEGRRPIAAPGGPQRASADVDGDGFPDRRFLVSGGSLPTTGIAELRARTHAGIRVTGFVSVSAAASEAIQEIAPTFEPSPLPEVRLPMRVRLVGRTVEVQGGDAAQVEVDVYDVRGRHVWGTRRDSKENRLVSIELPTSLERAKGLHFVRVRAGTETRVLRQVSIR